MRRIGRSLHSRRLGRLGTAVALCGLLAALLPTAATAAAPKVTFQLCIGCANLWGQGPARTNIVVVWKSSVGDLLQKVTVKSGADGSWSTPQPVGKIVLTPGDTIKASIGTWSRTFAVVPRLSLQLDRPSGVASGHGPSNTNLDLQLGTSNNGHDVTVTTDASGAFSHDFGADGANVDGNSSADVMWNNTSGDSVARYVSAPQITFGRGSPFVDAVGSPGTRLDVELLDASLAPKGEALLAIGPYGHQWDSGFADADGIAVNPKVGDHVQARLAGAASPFVDIVVPAITIAGVASTDVVTGTCVGAADYSAAASAPDFSRDFSWNGHVAAGKSFSRDITAKMDLRSGDRLELDCTLPTGDIVTRIVVVP